MKPTPARIRYRMDIAHRVYKRMYAQFDLLPTHCREAHRGLPTWNLNALFTAFADSAREIETADLVKAAKVIVPLAKTKADTIYKLREWAKANARRAGRTQAAEAKDQARMVDL